MTDKPRVLNARHIKRADYPDAVFVGRYFPGWGSSRWGNLYKLGRDATREEREEVVERFRADLLAGRLRFTVEDVRRGLVGRDLVCSCAPDLCHGDVLLELANAVNEQG